MRWIHTSGIVLVLFGVLSGLLGSASSWKLETLRYSRRWHRTQWKIEAQCADIFSYLQFFFFVCLPEYSFLCLLCYTYSSAHRRAEEPAFLLMLCFGWKIFEQVKLCCKDIKDNYYWCCNKTFSISVPTLFCCLVWNTELFYGTGRKWKAYIMCAVFRTSQVKRTMNIESYEWFSITIGLRMTDNIERTEPAVVWTQSSGSVTEQETLKSCWFQQAWDILAHRAVPKVATVCSGRIICSRKSTYHS